MGRRSTIKQTGLAVLKQLGVFAIFRFLTRKQLRILCYHGGAIGDETQFNPKLFCSEELLNQRLAWMRLHGFTPVALDDAVDGLVAREPKWLRPVVITIDDGWYSSRVSVIEPILKASFKATLYLATEVMQRQIPVLDVALSYVIWKAQKKEAALAGIPAIRDGTYDLRSAAIRQALYTQMLTWLKGRVDDPGLVCAEIERFAQALGISAVELGLNSRRFSYLTSDELLALNQDGCDMQLHGHAHLYPLDQPDALRADIAQCRSIIESLGMSKPSHYCYPSGEHDAHAETVLADLAVKSGTTCIPGLISFRSPPPLHLLPRFLDGEDVSQLDFEAEMSGVLQFARHLRRVLRT